jgi:hypothetical protein
MSSVGSFTSNQASWAQRRLGCDIQLRRLQAKSHSGPRRRGPCTVSLSPNLAYHCGNMDALLGQNRTMIMDRSVKTVDGTHSQNFIEFSWPHFLACTSGSSSSSHHFIAHVLLLVTSPLMSPRSTHMVWFFTGRDQLRQNLISWPLIKVILV